MMLSFRCAAAQRKDSISVHANAHRRPIGVVGATAGRPEARAAAASAGREHEVSEGEQDLGGAPLGQAL